MANSNVCVKMEIAVLIVVEVFGLTFAFGDFNTQEYCSTETFKAKCHGNDLVLMQSAMYGRMEIGRCVKKDFGSLGCSNDVLHIADSVCSGESECEIRIPDSDMNIGLDCSIELSRYLDAAYTCVTALTPLSTCQSPVKLSVTSHVSHIPSSISAHSPCGTKDAPWMLQAATGQTINISLIDFYWSKDQPTRPNIGNRGNDEECHIQYGYIIDSESNNEVHAICGGGRREKHVYVSSGHRLQLVIDEQHLESVKFLLRYHAVGCPDLVTPQHAWSERKEDKLIVSCKATRQTWHLKCQANRWVGVIGNCTQYLPNMPESKGVKGRSYLSYSGMAILVIIGVAGGISFVIITIGIVCYKRLSTHNKKMQAQYQCSTYKSKELYNVRDNMEEYKHFGYPEQIYPFSKNEYTHIWDQQGTPCSILDSDDIQQPMPVNDAPLLPKTRTNNSHRNNNNIDSSSEMPIISSSVSNSGDVQPALRDDVLYRASVSDSTGSASTGLSKYYVLDKNT